MSSGEEPVSTRVHRALIAREEDLAVAESATGGLVCSKLTDLPGASAYFERGFVTYTYDAKLTTLGVPREDLDTHGAVSEPVARQMARGARDRAGTRWGISVTGIAGPTGGTTDKPVGTTYIGVSVAAPWGSGNSNTTVTHYTFDGDRTAVRHAAATQVLTDLLDRIDTFEED